MENIEVMNRIGCFTDNLDSLIELLNEEQLFTITVDVYSETVDYNDKKSENNDK